MIKILFLGAGVQSTTLLLMSYKGLLPWLDCAIFADTGWESKEVYEHLERLEESNLGIPIHRVKAGDLRSDAMISQVRGHKVDGVRWTSMPMYTDSGNGSGMIKRQCTTEYKIVPIERFILREILGIGRHRRRPKKQVVEQWYGISVDEVQRMRISSEAWKVNIYPLCGMPNDMLPHRYSRADCLEWLKANWPYAVPRSACLGCPFHSNAEWRKIKANPEYWKDVTEFDRAIRNSGGLRGKVYLHQSLKPLEEADLGENTTQLNLFNNECTGMCGV